MSHVYLRAARDAAGAAAPRQGRARDAGRRAALRQQRRASPPGKHTLKNFTI